MKRNRAIDYEKGIIVAAMVLCHVLQFFGKPDKYPEQHIIMLITNFAAFSTLVFAYGRSTAVAYMSRPWAKAAPRMLKSALRSYIAFVISGAAYLVLCGGKDFSSKTVLRVLTFDAVPGWSEFLAAFAALGLVTLVLFPLLKKLAGSGRLTLIVGAVCFACSFIPYGIFGDNRLGLLFGTYNFSCVPVLQYLPFFLAGLYVGVHGMPKLKWWLIVSGAATAAGVAWLLIFGEPRRFPPSLMWLLTPCLLIVLLDRGAELLGRAADQNRWADAALSPVASMGMNSLYYLLASNIVIFSSSYMGLLPRYRRSEMFPFSLEQGSTAWALVWTLVMLLIIGFTAGLTRRSSKRG